MSLNSQLKSFKKSFKANADVAVKRAGQAGPSKESIVNSNGTISNNTKASFESTHEPKKRKKTTGNDKIDVSFLLLCIHLFD